MKQIQYAYVYMQFFSNQEPGRVLFQPLSSGLQDKRYESFTEAFDALGEDGWHITAANMQESQRWLIFVEREIDKPKAIEERFSEVFDV